MARQYENFDVVFEADGPRYRAIFASLEGQPTATLDFPLDEHELETFLGLFGKHQRRRMESPELARATAVGRRLFDELFDDELRARFLQAINDAKRDRKGVRIRLDLSNADDLITLPWEYLYRIEGDDFVALSNYTPVIRYLEVGEPLPPAPLDGPLRVLVMISDPIERRGTLDVEREWQQLVASLRDEVERGDVVLTRLPDGRLESLQTELQVNDYHVFHFIGHGEFSDVHDDGVLVMEDARARETHVPGRLLGDYLRDCLTMRLVVLNNCEGAATSESDPFAGSAQSLLRKGLPAVVAMQFEITDQAAIDFARGFYVGLMNGFPVEGALAEARKTMRRGPTIIEFGSPVLYMSADDGAVFEKADVAHLPEETDDEPAHVESASEEIVAEVDEILDEMPSVETVADTPAPPDFLVENAVSPARDEAAGSAPPMAEPSAPIRDASDSALPDDPIWKRPLFFGGAALAAVVLIVAVVSSVVGDNGGGGTTVTTEETTTTMSTVVQGPVEPTLQVGVQETFADRLIDPIAIDGSDEEWTSRFSFESDELVFNRNGDSYSGPDDLSSVWRAAWDDQFLYLFVEVTDDVFSQNRSGSSIFNGDALGIYFDPDLSNNVEGGTLRPGEHSGLFLGRHGLWVRLEPDASGAAFGGTNAVTSDPQLSYVVEEVEGGYVVEAQIPWSLLRVASPAPGSTYRMTRDVSDSDVAEGDSLQQAMVSNSPGRTAENQEFTDVWPVITLLGADDEPPEPGPLITSQSDGSDGEEPLVSPSVEGLPVEQAVSEVEAIGLTPHVSFRTSDSVAATSLGLVVSQDPPAGTEVDPTDQLAMVVHFGPIGFTQETIGKSGTVEVGISSSSAAAGARGIGVVEDLMDRIFGDLGVSIVWRPLTASEQFLAVSSGEVDLFIGDLREEAGVSASQTYDQSGGYAVWSSAGDSEWTALVQANVERYLIETTS